MKQSIARIAVVVGGALLLGPLATARAATTILHNFSDNVSTDGSVPEGSLTLSGSKLFGMTPKKRQRPWHDLQHEYRWHGLQSAPQIQWRY